MLKNTRIYLLFGFVLVIIFGAAISTQVMVLSSQSATDARAAIHTITKRLTAAHNGINEPAAGLVEPILETSALRASRTSNQTPAQPILAFGQYLSAEKRLLAAANLTVSSNDALVLDLIEKNPYTIGFASQAVYRDDRETLRTVKLRLDNGRIVKPAPDAVLNNLYPISQVYYLYAAANDLRANPDLATFIGCYLNRIGDEAWDIGFLPPNQLAFEEGLRTYHAILGLPPTAEDAACSLEDASHTPIDIVGSASVARLTKRMADRFIDDGYNGKISIIYASTESGFEQFCADGSGDVLNADRPIKSKELSNCLDNGRRRWPLPLVKTLSLSSSAPRMIL